MKTHNLVQGTPKWHQHRRTHYNASDAATMLGIPIYSNQSRSKLVEQYATGNWEEADPKLEPIFQRGHEAEQFARTIIEDMFLIEFSPSVGSLGKMSASFDGISANDKTIFEHKLWNNELALDVANANIPDGYMAQIQQQLMISGAEECIFVVSDGTEENMVYHVVEPDQKWFNRIRDGWHQFEKDVANYTNKEKPADVQQVAIKALPAISVQIKGEVVSSNMPQFVRAADTFIASIKTDLETDEDFVNADVTCKFCGDAEKDLELAKKAAISQTASIDELMRTIDHVKEQLRGKRLMLEKLVAKRKEEIKQAILDEAIRSYTAFAAPIIGELGFNLPSSVLPDFYNAIKGRKTLAGLHEAVDNELTKAKLNATEAATNARVKLAVFDKVADGFGRFPDLADLVFRLSDEEFQTVCERRIAEMKEAAAKAAEARSRADAAAALAKEPAASQAPKADGEEIITYIPGAGMAVIKNRAEHFANECVVLLQLAEKSLKVDTATKREAVAGRISNFLKLNVGILSLLSKGEENEPF